MRIGANPTINTTSLDSSVKSSTPQTNTTKPAENLFQGNSVAKGPSQGATMRSAEMGIGSNLKASQLRNDTTPSLSKINLTDALRSSAASSKSTKAATSTTTLQVVGDATFRARVAKDLAKFAPGTTVDSKGYVHAATTRTSGHSQGYKLIDNLLNGKNKVTIGFVEGNAFTQSGQGAQGSPTRPSSGSGASVQYDPNLDIALPTKQANGTIKDEKISSEIVLAHELTHAMHAQQGTIDRSIVNHNFTDGSKKYTEQWRFEEFRTTGFTGARQGTEPSENSIRKELGYKPRATYLDRSSWIPAGSSNGIANKVATNDWKSTSTNGIMMCNCYGCSGMANSAKTASL